MPNEELTREDIQQALEDGECAYCGEETVDRLEGDETVQYCFDCNRVTN